jgi:N-carbamoylputrescine amidase
MPREIKAAFVQHACGEDRNANLNASIEGIQQAAAQGANLIVLQELHNGLYFCQQEDSRYFDWAESIPGPTTNALGEICRQLNVVVVASIFEKRAAGLYHNTAVVIETNGQIAGRYRKMHIPDDPGFYEKFYFTPGDLGFEPVDTSLGRLGVLVCWDQWYPEAARLMALSGAEILIYPTAIGWDPNDNQDEQTRQRDAWITSQRAHAIANGLHVISCNRVGFEADLTGHSQGIQFWGSSFIAGPQGEILTQAPLDQTTTQTATLNLDLSDQVRRIWPFLRDRRIDAYHDIILRYRD